MAVTLVFMNIARGEILVGSYVRLSYFSPSIFSLPSRFNSFRTFLFVAPSNFQEDETEMDQYGPIIKRADWFNSLM
jgi:hypothetical protein